MKFRLTHAIVPCLFAVVFTMNLTAAEPAKKKSPIEGFWMWSFTNVDGSYVTPRVRFRTKDDELIGATRFRSGSETPVTNLTFQGSQVSFDVVRAHNGEEVLTHYAGKLSGDTIKGKVTAKANGEERSYDWIARRPIGVEGTWRVSVDFGGDYPIESRLTLKQDGEKISGKYKGRGAEVNIHKGRFRDGKIYFEVERAGREDGKSTNRYHGKLVSDELIGTVEMNRFRGEGRQTIDWDAVRAD
ncbi:MAG TPA: hypothetical protein VK846_10210 [Candidatus Limnocylindria bacterium]|nr:hypothetical protein [Candidatus Limnocylindria bacterium]